MTTASPGAAAGGDSVLPNAPLPLLPSFAILFGGAGLWGLAMAACAFLSLVIEGRWQSFHLRQLLLIYFAGGLAAWPVVLPLARLLTRHRCMETRFAACFALLSLGTIGMTILLFALNYRQFYAQWHQPFGTRIWLLQFIFTAAGATYQFLVMGLRLYLPVGLPVLAGVSLWLATSMR
jgi:hypothetical protein